MSRAAGLHGAVLEQVGGLFRKPLAPPQDAGWAISRLTCIWADAETCGFPCRNSQLGFQTIAIFIARKKKKPCSYSVDIPLPVLPFHPLRAQESTQSLGE